MRAPTRIVKCVVGDYSFYTIVMLSCYHDYMYSCIGPRFNRCIGPRFNRFVLVIRSKGDAAGELSAVLLRVLWRTSDVSNVLPMVPTKTKTKQ